MSQLKQPIWSCHLLRVLMPSSWQENLKQEVLDQLTFQPENPQNIVVNWMCWCVLDCQYTSNQNRLERKQTILPSIIILLTQ